MTVTPFTTVAAPGQPRWRFTLHSRFPTGSVASVTQVAELQELRGQRLDYVLNKPATLTFMDHNIDFKYCRP